MKLQQKILIFGMLFIFAMVNMNAQIKLKKQKVNNFTKMDQNQDGKLSKEEYLNFAVSTFEKKDANADGKLESSECKMIDLFDENKDGAVSKDEFVSAKTKSFEAKDSNKDGFLDKNEFVAKAKSHMKKMKAKMKCGGGKCGGSK